MGTDILLHPGDVLYRQGDPADYAFILASGEISLFTGEGASRVETERRTAGSILGELSILTGQPRAVSVEALTPCRLFQIPATQILRRFNALDPMLKACVETSITFSAKLGDRRANPTSEAELAPVTLAGAPDLIDLLELDCDMERGLSRGEFFMNYQPIVTLEEGEIAGFEALMRWSHPARGAVPPDRFVAVAEEMQTVSAITDFALLETCRVLGRVQAVKQGPPLFASVNLSGQDIGRADLIDFISHVLALNDLVPSALRLEVTETALVPQDAQAKKNLEALEELGCGLAIDDFGTGYSNLGYLKSLPLSAIKIDRSFARDACANPVSHSIVKMLVGLGRELGVDVIAEGLETAQDAQALRDIGCGLAQGFVFSKPLSADDLGALLHGNGRSTCQVA
ncbi:MAG: EAL domain-containing protein [Litoreibacter sp.]|nr:EAL domain-containing protein [Litoreibacter sp.]